MRCYICGKEIQGYGNNPYPLCAEDDYESRCCDECNDKFVIMARIALDAKSEDNEIHVGDTVAVFHAKNSDNPIETIKNQEKFLAGIVEDIIEKDNNKLYRGSWGYFLLNPKTDIFTKI